MRSGRVPARRRSYRLLEAARLFSRLAAWEMARSRSLAATAPGRNAWRILNFFLAGAFFEISRRMGYENFYFGGVARGFDGFGTRRRIDCGFELAARAGG